METNALPKMNLDTSETDCCPRFEPNTWDEQELVFDNKPFVKANTFNIFHMPLNMGSVITKTWKKVTDAGADTKDEYLILSYDPSPWTGEHYFAVTKDVPGVEMAHLLGTFLTKVFEGPYQNAKNWVGEMEQYVKSKDRKVQKLYFFYTTCPKCAKHYGKNYVVAVAQV